MSSREGRLGIGIVGAGLVGPVLGAALAGAGHRITGISAVSDDSVERAEALLPGVPHQEVPDIVRTSELVLFAIPGSELPGLISGLTALEAWQPGQLVAHTAPEHGFGVFAPALASGVIPLALHPAMVFTGTSLDLARLTESCVAVTAPAPVLPIGQALAVEMGAEPIVVAEADRAVYAEAVEAARDFAAAVVRQSVDALRGIGVDQPGRAIASIVRASVDEALRRASGDDSGPWDAEEG